MHFLSLLLALATTDVGAAPPPAMVQAAWQAPSVGQAAPNFSLTKLGGGTWTLSDFRGKRPVVLVFGSFT